MSTTALHPDIQAALKRAAEIHSRPLNEYTAAEARQIYKSRVEALNDRTDYPDVRVEDSHMEQDGRTLGMRVYTPRAAGGRAPLTLFFHGGGFVLGDLDTHDPQCRQLASLSGSIVVAVDYRLAPEASSPAFLDDGEAAIRWLHKHGAALGGDSERIALVGDSAGGLIATAVALAMTQPGDPQPFFVGLIYPSLQKGIDRIELESHRLLDGGLFLTRELQLWYSRQVFPRDEDKHDPRLSVLSSSDWSRFPPAVILTAELDPLRDEGAELARRLRAAGRPCETHCYAGHIHGCFVWGGFVSAASDMVVRIATGLRRHSS